MKRKTPIGYLRVYYLQKKNIHSLNAPFPPPSNFDQVVTQSSDS
jgi:hypothetical protein